MNASAIEDLHFEGYSVILWKCLSPLGEGNLKRNLNITSSATPYSLELWCDYSFIIWKLRTCALQCKVIEITIHWPSLCQTQWSSPNYARDSWKRKNQQSFCFWVRGRIGQGNIMIIAIVIVLEKLRFNVFSIHRKIKASVSEKLCFRNGSVWTA